MKPVTFSVASSTIRMRLGRAPRYMVALPPVISAGAANSANRAAAIPARVRTTRVDRRLVTGIVMALRENQIDLAPVFLRRGAFAGPVGRMIQLVGHLRGPEAAVVAIEQVALHGRAKAGRAAAGIGFPARR